MIHQAPEPVTGARPDLLRAEWERIELLGHCLAQGRRGQERVRGGPGEPGG